jgi:hypothetical protein
MSNLNQERGMERRTALAIVWCVACLSPACGSSSSSPGALSTGGGGSANASGGGVGAGEAGTVGGGSAGAGTAGSAVGTGGSAAGATGGSGGASPSGSLPEGDNGIAAKHPGDTGIGTDADVIFADDFESYGKPADLNQRWDAVYQNQYVGLSTDPANVLAGKQALEFTLPKETDELSDATDKVLTEEQDVLFLRYYSKFEPPYEVVGSSHNGSSISAHYFINGQATPGVPADGTNKFLANLENWRGAAATPSPGVLNIYIYHPGQRSMWGDHFFTTGLVDPNTSIPYDFGPSFVSRPDVTPELGRWYCYEYMVKANTVGQTDGRISAWLDGKVVGDFPNLTLRTVANLKIDRFGLSFHIFSNPNGEAKKWYDNVVAAKSYIGPLAK